MKKPTRLTAGQWWEINTAMIYARAEKVANLFRACDGCGAVGGKAAREVIIQEAIRQGHAEHETYGRLLRNRSAGVSGAKGLGFYLAKFGIDLRCEDGDVWFEGRFRRPKAKVA